MNIHLLYEYIYEYAEDPERVRIEKSKLSVKSDS